MDEGGTGVRNRGVLAPLAGLAVICLLAVVFFVLFHKTPAPPAAPAQPAAAALPGDAYIDQSSEKYVQAVIGGDPDKIQRLRQTTVDAQTVRQEALGRYCALPASALKVAGVHDEVAISGNGAGQPSTAWNSVVTVRATQGSQVATFGVELAGSYRTNGAISSSQAQASAR